MSFLEHAPGTLPIPQRKPHPHRKGIGVLGLHEGRTLLLALNRCSKAYPVAGCNLNPDKFEASCAERARVCRSDRAPGSSSRSAGRDARWSGASS